MIEYNATVLTSQSSAVDDLDDELIDFLMDRLAHYHVAVGGPHGNLEVTITYRALNLRDAVQVGTSLVGVVLAERGIKPIGVDVLPTVEFDRRWANQTDDEMVSVTEAAEILGVSGARVRQLLDDRKLAGRKVGATWTVSRRSVDARASGDGVLVTVDRDVVEHRADMGHTTGAPDRRTVASRTRSEA